MHCVSGRDTNTWQGFIQEQSNDAVGRQEDTVRTIELVEEAGEGAEEIMNNISSAGAKRCAPAFATCALHS